MTAVTKRTGQFTETEIDDEIVVMHLGTGEFFSLTGSAAATWRLIDGTRDRSNLVAALSAGFDGEESEIASDVDEFLGKLQSMDLLEVG